MELLGRFELPTSSLPTKNQVYKGVSANPSKPQENRITTAFQAISRTK